MTFVKNIVRKKLIEYITFADKYGKEKYVEIPQSDVKLFADDFAELIRNAYADKGGNFEINNGNDLIASGLNFWMAKDIDKDPDADITIGGKETQNGVKLTVMGQDGSPEAKKDAVMKMIELMKTRGFYAEMDVDLAKKLNLTPVDNENVIRDILKKEINYLGGGQYERIIAGKKIRKVLVGQPIKKGA